MPDFAESIGRVEKYSNSELFFVEAATDHKAIGNHYHLGKFLHRGEVTDRPAVLEEQADLPCFCSTITPAYFYCAKKWRK